MIQTKCGIDGNRINEDNTFVILLKNNDIKYNSKNEMKYTK